MKGEREMSICEMQKEYDRAIPRGYIRRDTTAFTPWWRINDEQGHEASQSRNGQRQPKAGGIGAMYCAALHDYVQKYYQKYYQKFFKVKEAHAADLRSLALVRTPQDTTKASAAQEERPIPPQRPNSVFVIVGFAIRESPASTKSRPEPSSRGASAAPATPTPLSRRPVRRAAADEQPHPDPRAECGSGG